MNVTDDRPDLYSDEVWDAAHTEHTSREREAYCTGLERLATILRTSALPLPHSGHAGTINWFVWESDGGALDTARAFTAVIPGPVERIARGRAVDLVGNIDGLHVAMVVITKTDETFALVQP